MPTQKVRILTSSVHICQDFPWNIELRFTAQFENLPPKEQLPVQSDHVEEGLWVMEVKYCAVYPGQIFQEYSYGASLLQFVNWKLPSL